MPRQLISIALSLLFALPAFSQEPELKPKKLTLKPAKAPVPALKYRLLPEVRDLEPGNAAVCYFRSRLPEINYRNSDKALEQLHELMELPFDEFIRAKKPVGYILPTRALEEVDKGARREYCDWELLTRLRRDGFGTLLPELQTMRDWVTVLSYRARLELANGDLDKAVYTLQTMFAMGRHLAEGPTLIGNLVGAFLAAIALERVEEFLPLPQSPNLYWALSALPRPLIDHRKGFESERIGFEVHFPELKDIEKRRLTPKELERLANMCWGNELSGASSDKEVAFSSKLLVVGLISQQYPGARKALIDQGRKAEEIDELPVLQVVLTHNYQQFRRVMDDLLKWTYVPYWEGIEERKKVEAECRAMKLIPFGVLIPAVEKVHQASVRPDRKVAALRCIEALRMHVAETGKVPASFDEIKIVPIPFDPLTGKRFEYKAAGDVVTIYGPPPPGVRAQEGNVIHYEITIKR